MSFLKDFKELLKIVKKEIRSDVTLLVLSLFLEIYWYKTTRVDLTNINLNKPTEIFTFGVIGIVHIPLIVLLIYCSYNIIFSKEVEKEKKKQFLGNNSTKEVHDLRKKNPNCQISEILDVKYFEPDTFEQADFEKFEPCGWCIGKSKK